MSEMEQLDFELGKILADFPYKKVGSQVAEYQAIVKVRMAIQRVVGYRQQLQTLALSANPGEKP